LTGDRLPPLPDEELTDAQREAVARIASGPRGSLFGPFVPLLRSPEMMTRLQLVGEYIRFDSELADDLVELVILTVARHWDQEFEWGYHHPIALSKGLPESVVEAVGEGRRPADASPAVVAVWELVDELLRTRQVSDAAYEAALGAVGETGVIEAVATAGYYSTLAMTMNAARTPPPDGAPRLPSRVSPVAELAGERG
jgi:4-carboxymuconolactone decarboxylase